MNFSNSIDDLYVSKTLEYITFKFYRLINTICKPLYSGYSLVLISIFMLFIVILAMFYPEKPEDCAWIIKTKFYSSLETCFEYSF